VTTIRHAKEMQAWADAERLQGRRIGFVPTMGSLHEGHVSLVRAARQRADLVVVSIFVNPLQFGPKEDFSVYPRDFARDETLLAGEKVDVIYYPDTREMYPEDFATRVNVECLTDSLCGKSRPGHFQGVTTVVAKLFNAVKPHVVVFGAKDAQQALVIRRMARDLDFDIEFVVSPTVREPDGLAMSSRNKNLLPEHRAQAPVLFRSLRHAAEMIAQGERNPDRVINEISRRIRETEGRIDYISIVDTQQLREVPTIQGEILIALAVFFGKVRLIDNTIVNAAG
jgi:pantoate--beta-alanine ligase